MSRLVGEVKLQIHCLKNGCKVRDSARTSKVNTPGLLSVKRQISVQKALASLKSSGLSSPYSMALL
jgi:hypothetical protein